MARASFAMTRARRQRSRLCSRKVGRSASTRGTGKCCSWRRMDVVAHDGRDHGRSDQAGNDMDMDTYADDLAAVMDALDLKRTRSWSATRPGAATVDSAKTYLEWEGQRVRRGCRRRDNPHAQRCGADPEHPSVSSAASGRAAVLGRASNAPERQAGPKPVQRAIGVAQTGIFCCPMYMNQSGGSYGNHDQSQRRRSHCRCRR
jgi:hypothetical protein